MGTRGYRVYRYRGRFYIYYNHYDSYPEGLGSGVVSEVPTDPEKYRLWLEDIRKYYAKQDDLLVQFLVVDDPNSTPKADRVESVRDFFGGMEFLPSNIGYPQNDLFIEWVYTIDLDNEVFSVDDGAHFKLDKIPRDTWIQSLALDSDGRRTIHAADVPADSIANLALQKPHLDTTLISEYNKLQCQMVTAKNYIDLTSSNGHNHLLTAYIFASWARDYECLNYVLSWKASDFSFRQFAYAALRLAAGDWYLVSREEMAKLPDGKSYESRGYNLTTSSDGKKIFHPVFGLEAHLSGKESGSAPADTTYWYRNVLVSLDSNIDSDDGRKAAIVKMIEFGKSCGRRQFDAVVTSLQHIVFIRYKGDGVFEQSNLLEFFPIRCPNIVDPESRPAADRDGNYPKRQLDVQAYLDVWHNKRRMENMETGGTPLSTLLSGKESFLRQSSLSEQSRPDHFALAVASISPGFNALFHFLDSAAKDEIGFEAPNNMRLPLELCHMILDQVDDETYQTCRLVCHSFQEYIRRHIRLSNHVLIGYTPEASTHIEGAHFIFKEWPNGEFYYYSKPAYGGGDLDLSHRENTVYIPALGEDRCLLSDQHHAGLIFYNFPKSHTVAANTPPLQIELSNLVMT